MGRSKATSRMPKGIRFRGLVEPGFVRVVAADKEEVNVAALLDYVRSLSEETLPEETEDRPAKRAKVEEPIPSVTILRHELAFTATSPTPSSGDNRFQRKDVGRHLRFKKVEGGLSITPQVKSKTVNFETFLSFKRVDLSQSLDTVLAVMGTQSYHPEAEGCIWAAVDVDISQQNHEANIKFTVEVKWTESQSVFMPSKLRNRQFTLRNLLKAICLPDLDFSSVNTPSSLPLQTFYEAVCVPDQDLPFTKIPGLMARLFPFQRKSIQWLLNREGVQWSSNTGSDEAVLKPIQPDVSTTPISFLTAKDANGKSFAISPLFDVVTRDPSPSLEFQNLKGGILAEEMGLGKTLEIISLILLHRRTDEAREHFDPNLGRHVPSTKATLIVTPTPLLDQWLAEFRKHAPQLSIIDYRGLPPLASGKRDQAAIIGELGRHDVVVTSYDVLRSEMHSAFPPPSRSTRQKNKYERAISPLVEFHWWRVCIDEAQMVESSQSNVAVMARLIPRVNAWAVTGTPVQSRLSEDLHGLLRFLRFPPYAERFDVWERLCSQHQEYFPKLVHLLCLRHTKSQVRSEIELPVQKRYVITMPFSSVEETNYRRLFGMRATWCGLDVSGNSLRGRGGPEDPGVKNKMRVALDDLRQIVLQPTGSRTERLTLRKDAPLRTLAEVLDAMIDQSDSQVRSLQWTLFSSQLTRGHMLATLNRFHDALAIYGEVMEKNASVIADCRQQLQQEIQGAQAPVKERAAVEDDEEIVPQRVSDARRRLKLALGILHRGLFFSANAHYSLKSAVPPESEEFLRLEKLETEGYDAAKGARAEMLQEEQGKAKKLMNKLAERASNQDLTVIPRIAATDRAGIENAGIADAYERLRVILDRQAAVLDTWRKHVIQLLLKPLVDEETGEVTGEEYEESVKLSEEIQVYLQALKTVLADRHQILSGQSNGLVEHEFKTSVRLARDGDGPCPKELLALFKTREEILPAFAPGDELSSMRAIITALRNLSTKLQSAAASGSLRARNELVIATPQLKLVQQQLTDQTKVITSMEREADFFTNTMNARIDYYAHLQAVSDTLGDYEGEATEAGLALAIQAEEITRNALSVALGRQRYYLHLKEGQPGKEDSRFCVICRETFLVGVLTKCGHEFCKSCLAMWFQTLRGPGFAMRNRQRNCPTCKEPLGRNSLHNITSKPNELRVHAEDVRAGHKLLPANNPTKPTGIYSEFNGEQLAQIKNVKLDGPIFTTKVNALVRHILWLRDHDPGAKAVVFSQYPRFLQAVAYAFDIYRIGYVSFDKTKNISKYHDSAEVEVFLLHARAHSSGLNLVNASHVFLCEPILNTALELQAIARVDRIGQRHETTVWLYVVEGTVEESIYSLSVQKRLDHMMDGRDPATGPAEQLDASLEAANSLELQQASLAQIMGKGGISGELVEDGDLWQCLFGPKTVTGRGDLVDNSLLNDFMAGPEAHEDIDAAAEAEARAEIRRQIYIPEEMYDNAGFSGDDVDDEGSDGDDDDADDADDGL